MWRSELGLLPVDWTLTEVWAIHLSHLVRANEEYIDEPTERGAVEHVEYESSDTELDQTRLVAQRSSDGRICCVVVGYDECMRNRQVQIWREAVALAAERVAAGDTAAWAALIGFPPDPQFARSIGDQPIALAAPVQLGPTQLLPGGVLMHEMPDAHPHLIGEDRYPFSSWPMIAQGTVAGFGELPGLAEQLWPMDDHSAYRHVHRLTALVTLAWGRLLIVRREPYRISTGAPVEVPHLPGPHGPDSPWATGCTATAEQESGQRADLPLPEWAGPAWDALGSDPVLDRALNAFYRARLLEVDHPSAAVLLYVTTIEGIGVQLSGPNAATSRARASFQRALQTVMSMTAAEDLTRRIRPRRNQTAHTGQFHGAESTLGFTFNPLFDPGPARTFQDDDLSEIGQAASDVLRLALRSSRSQRLRRES